MKYLKLLFLFLLMIISISLFSGISDNSNCIMDEYKLNNIYSNLNTTYSLPLIKKANISDRTIKINNQDIELYYLNTFQYKNFRTNEIVDIDHFVRKDGIDGMFSFDSKSNELTSMFADALNKGTDRVLSYEEKIDVAKEFLNNYVDINKYTFIESKNHNTDLFVFSKIYNGIVSEDVVKVNMNDNGVINTLCLPLYKIPDNISVPSIDIGKANQKVDEYIKYLKGDNVLYKIVDSSYKIALDENNIPYVRVNVYIASDTLNKDGTRSYNKGIFIPVYCADVKDT